MSGARKGGPNFMTVPEVGRQLGVGSARAYEMAAAGMFPSVRLGARIVVPRAAFKKWLETLEATALANVRDNDPAESLHPDVAATAGVLAKIRLEREASSRSVGQGQKRVYIEVGADVKKAVQGLKATSKALGAAARLAESGERLG